MQAMKIFVSVGTHPQQFDRLLKELDGIAEKNREWKIFAQTGNSNYKPAHYEFKQFMEGPEYERAFGKADAVISHGGAGTIINAMLQKKPLLVVPRLKKFGEHTNDHQLDLAKALEKEGKALAVFEIKDLEKKLSMLKGFRPKIASNKQKLVSRIAKFLGNE